MDNPQQPHRGPATHKPYDYLFKFVLIGDSSVGKSCLLQRFSNDRFEGHHIPTIGVDFRIKTLTLEGKTIKLQMWDTAGQERFRTITNSYYRGAHGVIIVYDVTNSASFESIRHWLYDIAEYAPEGVPKLLVGNKSDLVAERAISTDQGQTLAESLGMEFVETSAKTAAGVQRVFLEMTSQVMENTIHRNLDSRRRLPSNSGPTIRIVSRSFLSGQGCC